MDTLVIVLFWLALSATAVSGLIYIKNFFSKREVGWLDSLAGDLAVASFVLLALSLLLHWFYWKIPEIGVPFSARTIYALSLIGVYLLIESVSSARTAKVKMAGMLVMPAALLLEFYAWAGYRLEYGLSVQLRSYWVAMHVFFALIAYGAITVALTLALIHIVEERQLKRKVSLSQIFRKFPSLETLDDFGYKAITFGFAFLTLVILTGAIRAQMLPQWQRWWMDPKILSAAAMWLVFGFYLASRNLLGWRGRRASLMAIVGFLVGLFTYFVNYILPSIHTYGRGF